MKYTKNLAILRTKSSVELEKVVGELKEKLRVERLDIMTGKSKNGSAIGKLKREIARVLTVAKEPRA